ncbi:hypothetical protein J2Z26_002601 [Bacillus luteolus]|nr:hypothetical protein [Cytobacillus luteolus]
MEVANMFSIVMGLVITVSIALIIGTEISAEA